MSHTSTHVHTSQMGVSHDIYICFTRAHINIHHQFNAIAKRSVVRVEMFDFESMGVPRTMGSFSFIVPSTHVPQVVSHK